MILLRLLSWQYFRSHPVRSLLTLVGIALGVAVFAGMYTANRSVLNAFEGTVERIAGSTQLRISAGEAGFPEEILDQVLELRDIRVAAPVIEASAQTGIANEGNLLVLGVDMTGDQSLREYSMEEGEQQIDDPLVFLAQPDSIMVSEDFARRNQLEIGDSMPLETIAGTRQVTVRGVMGAQGLASAFGGNMAVMDIYAAQRMFGRGYRFDWIDIAVKDGVDVEQVQAELQQMLGGGFQVEPPASRGAQFESLVNVYAMTANVTSGFALFIGIFIIFSTFSIAVAQRQKEIGILRALGATQGQVRTLFVTESLLLGFLGSAFGTVAGLALTRTIANYVGPLLGEVLGIAQPPIRSLPLDGVLLAWAMALGIGTSMFAAFLPAARAGRTDPIQALRNGKSRSAAGATLRNRWRIAATSAAVAILCFAMESLQPSAQLVWLSLGFASTLLAVLTVIASLSRSVAQLLRLVLERIFPVEGALATDSIIEQPQRSSGTVAALMLSLALAIALGGLAQASYASISNWTETAFNPDLFVAPSQRITDRSLRFPGELGDEIAAVPGIAEVQSVRTPRVVIGDSPVMLIALDAESAGRRVPVEVVRGDQQEMYRLTAQGQGVIASENFTLLHGYSFGDHVSIPAPQGILDLPIVGVIRDYSDQQGSLLIDRSVYSEYWQDDAVNLFRVYLDPGADPGTVKQAILSRLAGDYRLFVLENADLKAYILGITDQWFGLTYIQIGVAVLVAILGIVNSITVSVADRRRELGILQAIGGLQGQIRRVIWLEAMVIGITGLALGFALGVVCLHYCLDISQTTVSGFRLGYDFPWGIAANLVPVVLVASFLAALGPAEGAVRGSLVEALEYE